jgi:hypothetical protein
MNYKSIAEYQEAQRSKAIEPSKGQQPEIDGNSLEALQQEAQRLEALHTQLCAEHGDSGSIRQKLEETWQKLEDIKELQESPDSDQTEGSPCEV